MAEAEGRKDLFRMGVCAVGIILSFSMWGYMLEYLTSGGKKMSETGQFRPSLPRVERARARAGLRTVRAFSSQCCCANRHCSHQRMSVHLRRKDGAHAQGKIPSPAASAYPSTTVGALLGCTVPAGTDDAGVTCRASRHPRGR